MNLFFYWRFSKSGHVVCLFGYRWGSLKYKKAQQAVPAEELQSELDYRTLTALANTTSFHLWLDITNEA